MILGVVRDPCCMTEIGMFRIDAFIQRGSGRGVSLVRRRWVFKRDR